MTAERLPLDRVMPPLRGFGIRDAFDIPGVFTPCTIIPSLRDSGTGARQWTNTLDRGVAGRRAPSAETLHT